MPLLSELGKIKNLLFKDYIDTRQPINIQAHTAQKMEDKNFYCNLECSQAIDCFQMAIQNQLQNSRLYSLAQPSRNVA